MKVFVAGATGTVGKAIVRALLASHHQVFAMARSKEKGEELAKIGSIPVYTDAFDAKSVQDAIVSSRPDAVINMLTALPKEYTPESMRAAAEMNEKLRTVGGANLQAGAKFSGVRRFIMQSAAFWYAPGKGLAAEEEPFAFSATPGIAAGCRTYRDLERAVLDDRELDAVAMRYGFFYGPGTWFEKGQSIANQVFAGKLPLIGEGKGIWNFVHVDDAARATAAALNEPVGVYNINDDHPIAMHAWLPAYARQLGAPKPPHISIEEGLRLRGPDTVYYANELRAASNAKAKRLLLFKPRRLEWL